MKLAVPVAVDAGIRSSNGGTGAKSSASAVSPETVTVTTTASGGGSPGRVAVTRTTVSPAPSSTVDGSTVSVCDAGASNPPPETDPDTVTCLSGPSTVSSTAVTVTAPVLVVEPATIVSSRFVLNSKSPVVAGDTAVADTVTVAASPIALLSAAVTVLTPPFSSTDEGVSTSVTVGASRSSSASSVIVSSRDRHRPGAFRRTGRDRQIPIRTQLEITRCRR